MFTDIKTFDPIYKKDSKGNVRVWKMELGYNSSDDAGHRVISGLQNGQLVTSGWKKTLPKNTGKVNSTNSVEQAELEIAALYTKKRDTGYFDNLDDIGTFAKTKPMLASKFEDHKFDFEKNEYYSQPKIDGIRCIARKDGLWSRTGKEIISIPHISYDLTLFFERYPDAVLDGELYNHNLKDDFNKITSLVRKTKPINEDLEKTKKHVEYHIYDMVNMSEDGKSLYGVEPFFCDRFSWIKDELSNISSIKFLETNRVTSLEEIDQFYSKYLENGYEGQMVRMNAVYQENKRSKYLMKRKEFLSDEFKVVAVTEGKGNWAGYVKQFVLELSGAQTFGAGVRGDQQTLKELFESNKKPTWATVRYFTPTPDGIPRFPIVVDYGYGHRED